jgi:hypothetical protein
MSRHAKPVFLDQSGRRRRAVKLAGLSLGIALLLTVGLFAVALSPSVSGFVPGLPRATHPQADPDGLPLPSTSASPAAEHAGAGQTTVSRTPTPTSTTASPTPTGHGRGNSHTTPPHPTKSR